MASGRSKLAEVISKAPRVSLIWPDFRGGGINYVGAAERSEYRPLVDLGFTVVGIEKGAEVVEGYAEISTELLGDLETDTILTGGPVDWTETPAAAVLETVDMPVVWVSLPQTQPVTGPITDLDLLNGYATALLTAHG